jgi:hypothetical protein
MLNNLPISIYVPPRPAGKPSEELDALRAELAEAFERQAAELEATSQQLSMVLALNARQQQELERTAPRLDESATPGNGKRLVTVERELGETHEKLAHPTTMYAHCASNVTSCARSVMACASSRRNYKKSSGTALGQGKCPSCRRQPASAIASCE